MASVGDLETRLGAVEDELEIRSLAAKFTDAVNERDVDGFAQLWAAQGPVWEIGLPLGLIGPPLASRAEAFAVR